MPDRGCDTQTIADLAGAVDAPPASAALDMYRAEYAELKSEQRTRITTRDNLGYATWAGIGLVLAATRVTETGRSGLLWLALPVVVVVLGWTRVQNDLKISRIAQYIGHELAPRVSALTGTPTFGWEAAHNGPGSRRTLRMACQLVADLTLYTAAPTAALIAFWATTTTAWSWLAVSLLEALLVIGLATILTIHSGLTVGARP